MDGRNVALRGRAICGALSIEGWSLNSRGFAGRTQGRIANMGPIQSRIHGSARPSESLVEQEGLVDEATLVEAAVVVANLVEQEVAVAAAANLVEQVAVVAAKAAEARVEGVAAEVLVVGLVAVVRQEGGEQERPVLATQPSFRPQARR